MKKLLILFTTYILISCNTELESLIFKQFQKFINKYKKKYSSINEYLSRYLVFKTNLMSIVNSKKSSYKSGITQFCDLTKQEFSKLYLNLNYDAMATTNFDPYIVKTINEAPESFDWRDYGVVGTPQNQVHVAQIGHLQLLEIYKVFMLFIMGHINIFLLKC